MVTSARRIAAILALASGLGALSCNSMGSGEVLGNENGSDPINDNEANDYKKAIVRCYKTGGTRVVKIMGELRCY